MDVSPVNPDTLVTTGPATNCADANENGVCDDQEKPEAETACADADADTLCDDVDDDIDGDGIPNALDEQPTVRSGRIFDRLAFIDIESSVTPPATTEDVIAFTYGADKLLSVQYDHDNAIAGQGDVTEIFSWPNSAPFDPGSDTWHLEGLRIFKGPPPHAEEQSVEVTVQRQGDRIVSAQVHYLLKTIPLNRDYTIAYEKLMEDGVQIDRAEISGPITLDAGKPEEVTTKARHACRSSVKGKGCALLVTNPYVVPAEEIQLMKTGFDQLNIVDGLVADAQFSLQFLENPATKFVMPFTTKRDAATHSTAIESKVKIDTTELNISQQWHEGQDIRLAEATRVLIDILHAVAFDYYLFPANFTLP